MSAETIRLFAAAAVPPEHLREIEQRTRHLQQLWPAARWTPLANQHITLKFLGSTQVDQLERVQGVCREVARPASPADLRLRGLGVFPNLRRARVVWVGVQDPAAVLTQLAADLDRALEPLGFPSEKRAFTPHLTLARFRQPQRLDSLPGDRIPALAFSLQAFDLWRSHLSPRGARYELVEGFPLGAATFRKRPNTHGENF